MKRLSESSSSAKKIQSPNPLCPDLSLETKTSGDGTYFGYSLRFIWISLILSLSFVSIVIANVLEEIHFELQHSVFMVFISFAIVIYGGIFRYKMLIIAGIVFAMCAIVASYMELKDQLVLEAIGWIAGFIVPGAFILYAKGKYLTMSEPNVQVNLIKFIS